MYWRLAKSRNWIYNIRPHSEGWLRSFSHLKPHTIYRSSLVCKLKIMMVNIFNLLPAGGGRCVLDFPLGKQARSIAQKAILCAYNQLFATSPISSLYLWLPFVFFSKEGEVERMKKKNISACGMWKYFVSLETLKILCG